MTTTVRAVTDSASGSSIDLTLVIAGLGVLIALLAFVFGGRGAVPALLASVRRHSQRRQDASSHPINTLRGRPISFIPRDTLVQDGVESLERGGGLLIEGPRGAGKTTLAVEIAHRYIERHRDASAISVSARNRKMTCAQLMDEIARQLKLTAVRRTPPELKASTLTALLAGEKVLILIDNFESLRDDERDVVDALNGFSAEIKVLITTVGPVRELLELPLRHIGEMRPEERLALITSSIANDPALQELGLTSHQIDTIAVRTGGNPLAIKWALGKLRNRITFVRLLEILDTGDDEHFNELFDDTWQHLSPSARLVLSIRALYPDDVPVELLKHASDLTADAFGQAFEDLLGVRLLEPLVASSNAGESRLCSLHPLAHGFVSQRTDSEPAEHRVRYLIRCAEFFERFARLHEEGAAEEDIDQLSDQMGSITRTLDLCVSAELWAQGITLAVGVEEAFLTFGFLQERAHYGQLLAPHAHDTEASPSRSRLMTTAGQALGLLGDYSESERLLSEALDEAEQQALSAQLVRIQRARAANAFRQGDLQTADAMLSEGLLETAEQCGDFFVLIDVLYLAANVAYYNRQCNLARAHCERMLELVTHAQEYARADAYSLEQLALVELAEGQRSQAIRSLSRAATVAWRYQDRRQGARIDMAMAKAALGRRPLLARRLADRAAIEFSQLGLDNELAEATALRVATRPLQQLRWLTRTPTTAFTHQPIGGD